MNSEVVVKFRGDTKNLDNSTNEASSKLKGFASGIAKGMAVATGAVVGATAAVGSLVKSSVEAYADFEQLTGGVETLFKDSAGKVEEYAANAFKTAGMSANQYMETVTSFSASLLQSLNGDTAKAAEVADMAITDMSDNANKMGTSMEMIQSAYQGFAKQNYTMLDNLKLGYGGTKTEMERLLADATKISGVKYDISNLNDVYQAIHVVQEQIGITGTTAKEASETISGSLGMTKSAWENLITGISDKNADMGKLIDDFINSASTFIGNLLPVVETALNSIVNVLPGLIDKIMAILPGLIESILPVLIQSAIGLIQALANSLPKIIPVLMDGIVQAIKGIAQILPEIIQALIQATVLIIQALAEELPELLPVIIGAILDIIPLLIDNLPLFIKAGYQLLTGLIQGIIQSIPKLYETVFKLIKSLIGYFKQIPGMLIEVGSNMLKGLWQGISNVTQWIIDKIKGFGSKVLKSIKGIFGIHSPSKEFAWIGKMNMIGFEEGMESMKDKVQSTIDGVFNMQPDVSGTMNSNYSPSMTVNVQNNMEVDPIGQVVNKVKTFSGGAKNDYNWGAGI